jgi:WD40 repeat protein/energy-coupling factor transporter ATP-binding protein EcfA2
VITGLGAPSRTVRGPFPGLRSFSQDESELFFGREGQSDELARKLGKSRFVAVVGTSGSGKSSLVRAGLLPSLEGGCLVKMGSNWRVVDLRPGGHPISSLATALDVARVAAKPIDAAFLRNSSLALLDFIRESYQEKRLEADENLLILVDQFEELFRYKSRENDMEDRDEKAAFVKLLLEVAKQREFPIFVVITMRSDFLGDCARFRDLPEAINAGQYLVPRMTRDQRRGAIEGPVHMAGGEISPRLVQRILNDVGEDPDQLPVMQHALMRTWFHWRDQGADRPVDIEDYEAIGTLENALSSHADEASEEACNKVPQKGGHIVKRIFQRLRERDSSGREVRRPSSLIELCSVSEASQEDVSAVLECFRREGRSFLMPPMTVDLKPEGSVDITHESLLRQWKRLLGPPTDDSGWLAEEEESRRTLIRLADRAEQQVQGNPDYLRGPLLQLSLDWWNRRKPTEAWAGRYTSNLVAAEKYLRESEENEIQEARHEEERKQAAEMALMEKRRSEEELKAKRHKARVFRSIAIVAFVGLAVASALAVYAWMQRGQAEGEKRTTQTALNWANRQYADSKDLNGKLNSTVNKLNHTNDQLTAATKQANASATQAKVSAAEALKEKKSADAARTAAQALNQLNDKPDLAFLLAVEASRHDETPETLNSLLTALQTVPNLRSVITDHTNLVRSLVFRGDNLTSADDGGAMLIHTDQGALSGRLAPIPRPLMITPDAAYVLASGNILWNAKTGKKIEGMPPISFPLAFSGDGALMAWFSEKDGVKLWDLTNNRDAGLNLKSQKKPTAIALGRNGKILAIAYGDSITDSTVTLWDLKDVLHPLQGKTLTARVPGQIPHMEFDPNTRFLAAEIANSATISMWDLTSIWDLTTAAPRPYPLAQNAQNGFVSSLAFSGDGTVLASGTSTGYIAIWPVNGGEPIHIWLPQRAHALPVTSLAFSADGKTLASAEGIRISLWSVEQQNLSQVNPNPAREYLGRESISFTRDGNLVEGFATSAGTNRAGKPIGGEVFVRTRNPSHFGQPATQTQNSPTNDTGWSLVILSPDGQIVASEKYDEGTGPCRKSHFRLAYVNGNPGPKGPEIGERTVTSAAFSTDSRELVIATCTPPPQESKTSLARYEIVRWDLVKNTQLGKLPAEDEPTAVAISPDSNTLATASGTGESKPTIWNLRTGKSRVLGTQNNEISTLRFSPDANKFVSGTTDGSVTLWDAGTGDQLGSFANPGGLADLAFSGDGRTLVAASMFGSVALLDVKAIRQFGTLRTYINSPVSLAFNPRDSRMLAAAANGTVTLWNLDPASWKTQACRFANRNLSFDEWQQYEEGPYQKTCEDLPVSPTLMNSARAMVRDGNSKGAIVLLRRVSELDPSSHIDPEREVVKDQALEAASRANQLSRTRPLEALKHLQEAVRLDPSVKIAAETWNVVCWIGSLQGADAAATVMVACQKALEAEPDNIGFRDSRGLARAMSGDPDGAIADFQAYIDSGPNPQFKAQRQEWVKALQSGQNPFTPEVLKSLQNE